MTAVYKASRELQLEKKNPKIPLFECECTRYRFSFKIPRVTGKAIASRDVYRLSIVLWFFVKTKRNVLIIVGEFWRTRRVEYVPFDCNPTGPRRRADFIGSQGVKKEFVIETGYKPCLLRQRASNVIEFKSKRKRVLFKRHII